MLKANPDLLAAQHLCAYLEELCYWTAIATYRLIPTPELSEIDYFQIARAIAANPVRLFKKYDVSFSSINTYGQLRLRSAIFEMLRKGKEADKYSEWGLVRSVSKKFLKTALQAAGISDPQLSRCLLARQCFQ